MAGKPGRPRSLTLEQIAQAALDEGLATFSMPTVSRRVGVAHSALYRYVTGRDELLHLALERALSSAKWPNADQPWRDLLRDIGEATWELSKRFPGFDRALSVSERNSELWDEHSLEYVDTLEKQGFSRQDAAITVGFVARLALTSSREQSRADHQVESGALTSGSPEIDPTGRGWYDRQLDIVLAGAESVRTA